MRNSFIYFFVCAWCLLLMSSWEPFITTVNKQWVNELYISAEVSQRNISRGSFTQMRCCLPTTGKVSLSAQAAASIVPAWEKSTVKQPIWPPRNDSMSLFGIWQAFNRKSLVMLMQSCFSLGPKNTDISYSYLTTAVVTYNIFLNVTEVFLAPRMPNKEYYFLACISASIHSEVFHLTETWQKKKNNFTEEIQFDQPVQAACSISRPVACCLAAASGFSWRLHSAVHCRRCFPSPPVKPSWTVYWGPPAEPKTFQPQHITESSGNVRQKYPLQRYLKCYSYKAATNSHAQGV